MSHTAEHATVVLAIKTWLRKYPWLWAIRKSWKDVRIRSKRVTITIDLVQAVSVGRVYIYVETIDGPFVLTPRKELVGKEMAESVLSFLRHEVQNQLRFIAVEVGSEITVYKPPKDGWTLRFLGMAWSIADYDLKASAASV